MFNLGSSRFAFVVGLVAVAAVSNSQIIWNESVNGDLSGDRLNPTSLNLGFGSNGIVGTMMPGDREYVHLHLSPGMALGQIVVVSYVSDDPIAFIGVQAGTVFTEPHDNPEVANLLGYTLWGTDHIGTNVLPTMGSA